MNKRFLPPPAKFSGVRAADPDDADYLRAQEEEALKAWKAAAASWAELPPKKAEDAR